MERIYEPAAYGDLTGCWWTGTADAPNVPALRGQHLRADVAIIGAGFTGLNAAWELAKAGARVIVCEAGPLGFGASGRNGGFCCLGGAMAEAKMLDQYDGGAAAWYAVEKAAIARVANTIDTLKLDVDRHSEGETMLAHSPRAWRKFQKAAEDAAGKYGVAPRLTPPEDLLSQGLGGEFHGALTMPMGFALNPAKYLMGLARAALAAGVRIFHQTPVLSFSSQAGRHVLTTDQGRVEANQVILATNGYSSEDIPPWLRARYLPVQSSVIVTRPLTEAEQQAQGWTSDQMAYDSRMLLHYFRKLPDGRFLFGMRGGLSATKRENSSIARAIRNDFARLFPEWRGVEVTHHWQGLVCLMPDLSPYVGPVPGHPGLFAGLGFHGNGVAMGSYAGGVLADLVQGRRPDGPYPGVMKAVPQPLPLGRFRRQLLRPTYLLASLFDF